MSALPVAAGAARRIPTTTSGFVAPAHLNSGMLFSEFLLF
jgi:hypothetical protein